VPKSASTIRGSKVVTLESVAGSWGGRGGWGVSVDQDQTPWRGLFYRNCDCSSVTRLDANVNQGAYAPSEKNCASV
jgi:hypothetical protein